MSLEAEDAQRILDAAKHHANGNGPAPDEPGVATATADALAASRINLMALIRDGIPEREFVPGTGDALVRGKRHHIAAPPKDGKSLSIGVVAAIDIVAAGGTVVLLDRENGAEEYARRFEVVLDARKASQELRELVEKNYHYHAWPNLKLEWGKDPAYAQAFKGAGLVIFDSSRKFLTSVGLKEDSSDDYSAFAEALIDPLMQAGITTVILDNCGHDEKGRPRGSSAKIDLCDVMFSLKATQPFSLQRAGRIELVVTESRLGELTGTWALELGGGRYGSWAHVGAAAARSAFRDACIAALEQTQPLGRKALIKAAREHGAKGSQEKLQDWLAELAAEGSLIVHDNKDGYRLAGGYPIPVPPRTPHPPDGGVPLR
jgi:hypothetical protein